MKIKIKKKTFIARVVIKAKHPEKVPDFGLGKGVLGEQEVAFKDVNGRGFDNPLFAMAMVDFEKKMIDDAVEVKWEEKKHENVKVRKNRRA
jgi:hypothetical protein